MTTGKDEKSSQSSFSGISTSHQDYITWQEFISYLLCYPNDNNQQQEKGQLSDKEILSTTSSATSSRRIKKKKKVKSIKKLCYDMDGRLITKGSKKSLPSSMMNNNTHVENSNNTVEGVNKSNDDKRVEVLDLNNNNKNNNEKKLPQRSFVIGSKMNTGKLGGRHLQLHVYAGDD